MSMTISNQATGLIPQNMDQAMRLADLMARGKMLPAHLQQSPGDCLMVVEQAMRWGMSPFAVAQNTFSIKGKLLFAGTLVHAAIETSGAIDGLIDYEFFGEGAGRGIRVSGKRRGETVAKTVDVLLKDAQTANDIWKKQPDQQLVYHGVRVWGRRWTPSVLLGVYAPEEMAEAAPYTAGPTIEAVAEPVSAEPPKRTAKQFLDGLEHDLAAAADADQVDEITARPDVQKALDVFTNGLRDRLNALISQALRRTAATQVEDEDQGAEMMT